ncbi:hypothetical protein N0V82_003483 [Gnomoniopsis sp. IMI 355080]|nr:hypothetical protein N0V82_003483 [Gnomoniopsis sp. IMI 355080]
MDASSPPAESPTSDRAETDKPRLTDAQKRQNHITSEQKRREAIRRGFDKICEVLPGLEGQGRSEGVVLNETTKLLLEAIIERKRLVAEVERRGGVVPEHLLAHSNIDISEVNLKYIYPDGIDGSVKVNTP